MWLGNTVSRAAALSPSPLLPSYARHLHVLTPNLSLVPPREPFQFMKPWPDAGFLTTSDHLGNTTSDGGLEDHRGIHTAFNIGYMFFRKSALPLVSPRSIYVYVYHPMAARDDVPLCAWRCTTLIMLPHMPIMCRSSSLVP